MVKGWSAGHRSPFLFGLVLTRKNKKVREDEVWWACSTV